MQDPHTTRIIHERMIQEELQRNYPEHHLYIRESDSVRKPIIVIRRAVASFLFTLGKRVAPPSRTVDPSTHATTGSAN